MSFRGGGFFGCLVRPWRATRIIGTSRRWALALSIALAWIGILGHAQAQQRSAPPKSEPAPEYTISPGDGLHLFVWKEPELSREVVVRGDGRITVPLLGDLEAAGKAPQQLGREIGAGLGKYVEAPLVSVIITQANSAKVFVIGQVRNPGSFPLVGRMTVLQALSMAGGFLEFAKADKVLVIRDQGRAPESIQVNYKRLEDGSDLRQNIVLRPGDSIVVP